jgi:hypothetical protein
MPASVTHINRPRAEGTKPGREAPPKRRRNADVRSREYLTPEEVERLIAAARGVGRHGQRDAS